MQPSLSAQCIWGALKGPRIPWHHPERLGSDFADCRVDIRIFMASDGHPTVRSRLRPAAAAPQGPGPLGGRASARWLCPRLKHRNLRCLRVTEFSHQLWGGYPPSLWFSVGRQALVSQTPVRCGPALRRLHSRCHPCFPAWKQREGPNYISVRLTLESRVWGLWVLGQNARSLPVIALLLTMREKLSKVKPALPRARQDKPHQEPRSSRG